MEILVNIRPMHLRDNLSLHEITKCTGLPRNAIRRWLRTPEEASPPAYRRNKRLGKLNAFHTALEQALKVDAHRAKQSRPTTNALLAQIKAEATQALILD